MASFETLYSFPGPNLGPDEGASPEAGVIQGSDGNFYGATNDGGSDGSGTVFEITPQGVLTTLYMFSGGADGAFAAAGLIQGRDGNFYGTTDGGGNGDSDQGDGTVFKITPAGVLTTLYTFSGGADGAHPLAALTQGNDGNFYGTTSGEGSRTLYGTVFKMTPAGVLTTLYIFTGGADGANPEVALTQGSDGNFYGTTRYGGNSNQDGTIFKITPAGVLMTLYTFTGGADGAYPGGDLTLGSDGNFYGTTSEGGNNSTNSDGDGTVFKITPAGVLTTLYAFTGGAGSINPNAGVIQGSDGNFYGTAGGGDSDGDGTVFKITPAGVLTILYDFTGDGFGGSSGGLTLGSDGNFYGTTSEGGQNGFGSVFRLTLSTLAQPVITSPSVLGGQAGQAFTYQIVATNSPASYGASGLPYGLNVDSATGIISGVPTESGAFSITLYATNAGGTGSQTLSLLIAPALPIVTLMATIPEVSAESGDIGELTVSLSAPQTSDVIVNYTIKGSAINGTDYVLLTGTKKIKAGKTSKPIKIIPQGDLGGAAQKTVKLILAPGQGYTVGTTAPIKVKIVAGD